MSLNWKELPLVGVDRVDSQGQPSGLVITSNGLGGATWQSGGTGGAVTAVTATAPLSSSGGSTPNLSIDLSPYAPLFSPAFTGIPTAPTPTLSDNSTKLATTAFVQSQGFLTSTGAIPTGEQDNATAVTSATTTFVTALTTTVTLTQTASILAVANATLITVTSASVAGVRVTINAVASRVALITLSTVTTNYLAAVHFISAPLAPGTYTITFDIQRSSGTGTVSYASGTLIGEGLQGTNSNGITALTGDVTAGPGSGSQASTIAALAVTGAKIANATIANAKLVAATITGASIAAATIAGSNIVAATITGANIAATTITNANISTVDAAKVTTGTLPMTRGGTGVASIASGRVPFSNGTTLVTDPQFLYDTTNVRLSVGTGGGTGTLNVVPTTSTLGLSIFSNTGNHSVQIQNQAAMAVEMINASAGGGGQGTGVLMRATISRGTLVARTAAQSGDQVWRMSGLGYYDATHTGGETNYIQYVLSENYTSTAQGGEISLGTTPNGTVVAIERVRIKNSGETVFQGAVATSQVTTVQKNALLPAGGWVVFDTTLNQLSYYNGTAWVNL